MDFILTEKCKDDRVIEVAIKLIKHVIKKKSPIAYGELVKGLSFAITPRNVEMLLGPISYACKENGVPLLSVMVVNKDSYMPGDGFCKAYFPEIKNKAEGEKRIIAEMNKVLAYEHWDEVICAFEVGK